MSSTLVKMTGKFVNGPAFADMTSCMYPKGASYPLKYAEDPAWKIVTMLKQ